MKPCDPHAGEDVLNKHTSPFDYKYLPNSNSGGSALISADSGILPSEIDNKYTPPTHTHLPHSAPVQEPVRSISEDIAREGPWGTVSSPTGPQPYVPERIGASERSEIWTRTGFVPVGSDAILPTKQQHAACQQDTAIYHCVKDKWGTRQDGEIPNTFTFSLPGFGKITNTQEPGCGTANKAIACSKNEKHYKKTFAYNCGHIECPVCWTGPIGKVARNASSKIRGFIKAAESKGLFQEVYGELIVNHFIASFPPGVISPEWTYNKIKQIGRDISKNANITGGFGAFHPYRIKEVVKWRLKKYCRDTTRLSEEDREKKYWQLVREDILGLGDWHNYVVWGPHFHFVGFGRLPDWPDKNDTTPEAESRRIELKKKYKGGIVRWIRHVEPVYKFNGQEIQDSIAELVFYILSHAGYQPGRKIPMWLGSCSPNNLHKDVVISQEFRVVCPECTAEVLVGSDNNGTFVPDINQEDGGTIPYVLRIKEIRYIIEKRKKSEKKKGGKIWGPDGPPSLRTTIRQASAWSVSLCEELLNKGYVEVSL